MIDGVNLLGIRGGLEQPRDVRQFFAPGLYGEGEVLPVGLALARERRLESGFGHLIHDYALLG